MDSTRARRLRNNPTDAERRLWSRIRYRQVDGYRFRRQVPIGPYVVDFACLSHRLVIEVDGGQHAWQMQQDQERSDWLESRNFRILRFWNNDALRNIDGVVETIRLAFRDAAPPTPTLPRKEERET